MRASRGNEHRGTSHEAARAGGLRIDTEQGMPVQGEIFMKSLRRPSLAAAGLLILVTLSAGLASAQTARTGGTANAQLLQQLQQLASERTALQAENAQMKKDLDAIRKDRDALKKAQQAVEGRAKASETAFAHTTAERESAEKEVQQMKDKMQELIAKFRETVQAMREVEVERSTFKQNLATRDQELKVCVGHNTALYNLNAEVLDRLEHQSVWSRVASAEPFTKIKRVELENLVDDYKSRAGDQVLKSPARESGAPQAIAPETSRPAPTPAAAAPETKSPPAPAPAAAPPQQGSSGH